MIKSFQLMSFVLLCLLVSFIVVTISHGNQIKDLENKIETIEQTISNELSELVGETGCAVQ